jgi:LmbE family N-acetylglucosaminyl deacetylase
LSSSIGPSRLDAITGRARRGWRDVLWRIASGRAEAATDRELARRAVVFSPHFDDETLGCGGTLIRKIRAGAAVALVFMTDGTKSHRHRIAEHELSAIRSDEARRAAKGYGVPDEAVFMLGHEETHLAEASDLAREQCSDIVRTWAPEEIYIPYRFAQAPDDHAATSRIALAALRASVRPVWVNEYPIWFWNHWPFCRLTYGSRSDIPGLLLDAARRNLQLVTRLNHVVDVADTLALKQEILAEYRSQMTRLDGHPRWATLSDVSDGEFLACLLRDRELFRRYRVSHA